MVVKEFIMKNFFLFLIFGFSTISKSQVNDLCSRIGEADFFEDYITGSNDVPSIGLLENLFFDSLVKNQFIKINPNLTGLKVTGTAAPFEKKIPFNFWIENYICSDVYFYSAMKYSISYRSDGMVQEFLVITKDSEWQRTIIISRMLGSIITVWDSELNK